MCVYAYRLECMRVEVRGKLESERSPNTGGLEEFEFRLSCMQGNIYLLILSLDQDVYILKEVKFSVLLSIVSCE